MQPPPTRLILFPSTTLFRSEFWWYCAFLALGYLAIFTVGMILSDAAGEEDVLAVVWFGGWTLFFLANFVPGLALTNRRSEEHTSELQSRRDLVCRLLLEKKN